MKLHFKTRPWPHQVRVLKRMLRQRGGGVQVPMRWGKSWVGINWAAGLYHLEDVRRVVVVTVTSGLGVWEDQIIEHCPVPYAIFTHWGELAYFTGPLDGEEPLLQFMIVDFPNVFWRARTGEGAAWVPVDNKTLHHFDPQAVICDESHHIGDPTTEQSKRVQQVARKTKFRLFMTGTMFHRKPFYVFGQVKFYDDGRTFGTAWGHFKERVGIFGGYMNYEVKGYKNLKWMMGEIRKFTYIEKEVPKRPTVTNLIKFPLTGAHLKAYETMESTRVLDVGEDEPITAEIILTHHLRLLQIAGGFVKVAGGYKQVGNCKVATCRNRLEEYWEQDIHKAVIGCRFTPELLAVGKVAQQIGFVPMLFHGRLNGEDRRKRIRFFQRTDKPCLFISQIAAGKESIDLSAASVMMFFSLTESYVEFDQFSRRIEKFREERTLMYDFLLGYGTRDIVAYEAMRLKMDVAHYLQTNPERAEQLVAAKHGNRP